jgi:hypothetical protein
MRMARLATRSALFRQPQYLYHLVEETNNSPSSKEVNAIVHHRGSLRMYMVTLPAWASPPGLSQHRSLSRPPPQPFPLLSDNNFTLNFV